MAKITEENEDLESSVEPLSHLCLRTLARCYSRLQNLVSWAQGLSMVGSLRGDNLPA